MILNDLEIALVKRFLENNLVAFQDEEYFFSALNVLSRDYTGVGFIVEFEKSEKLKVCGVNESCKFGGLGAKLNCSIDTGYLFYVEKGFLTSIEGYTYAEDWPDSISEIDIYSSQRPGSLCWDVPNKVDDVINETLSANKKNITSQNTLTADEALEAGQKFLGNNYKEIGKPNSGVFRSADGTRQFRMDNGCLTGSHAPNTPHVHLETYKPGANKPTVNNHIPFVD